MPDNIFNYTVFYNSLRYECQAHTMLEAKEMGIQHFKVRPTKQHMVIAILSDRLSAPNTMPLA